MSRDCTTTSIWYSWTLDVNQSIRSLDSIARHGPCLSLRWLMGHQIFFTSTGWINTIRLLLLLSRFCFFLQRSFLYRVVAEMLLSIYRHLLLFADSCRGLCCVIIYSGNYFDTLWEGTASQPGSPQYCTLQKIVTCGPAWWVY